MVEKKSSEKAAATMESPAAAMKAPESPPKEDPALAEIRGAKTEEEKNATLLRVQQARIQY